MKTRKVYNRISILRRERGLSRKALADLIGVNPQTIGYLEREKFNPGLDLAFRLSDFFELPIEFIFSPHPMKPMSQELSTHLKNRGSPKSA